MDDQIPHRKLVRHFNLPGHAHELTFSCYKRLPLLDDDARRRLLSRSINAAMDGHRFALLAFVYMPEHLHLLVFPQQEDSRVESLLYAIKRPFSFRVKQQLLALHDPLLAQLTIRERPGKETFRFWQEGGGYDRNITSIDAIHVAADYIHLNPVRRGLCESAQDWKWSSLKAHQHEGWKHDPDLPVVKLPSLG